MCLKIFYKPFISLHIKLLKNVALKDTWVINMVLQQLMKALCSHYSCNPPKWDHISNRIGKNPCSIILKSQMAPQLCCYSTVPLRKKKRKSVHNKIVT